MLCYAINEAVVAYWWKYHEKHPAAMLINKSRLHDAKLNENRQNVIKTSSIQANRLSQQPCAVPQFNSLTMSGGILPEGEIVS